MSQRHIPFHLKYRPQTFDNIVGQKQASESLKSAIENNKITFAYLFAGQHGSGKTTLARIMARAINCSSSILVPCNVCENCLNIHSDVSFDFYEIDAAKNTGIENIREIIENIQFAPIMSRYKVCIIDEAHMLSHSAFNSLLKTLESPPINTVFILSTTTISKIPNTIISRCQKKYFQPIKDEDLIIAISKLAYKEKVKITNKAIINILNITKGSFRDALNTIELFAIQKQIITSRSISEKYLVPSLVIIEILIDNLLIFNLLEVLTIINYIKIHYWVPEDVINAMHDSVLNKYVNSRQTSATNKTLFLNTKMLIALLKCLVDCKFINKRSYWENIISFVLKNGETSMGLLKNVFYKRKVTPIYIQNHKIYSN